jgi:hypothetical protein
MEPNMNLIERIVAPALTFAVLIAGHAVIVASLLNGPTQDTPELVAKAAPVATAKQAG